jgi:hypothetical protein
MADPAPQNYENHVVVPVKLIVLSVVLLLAAILATAGLFMPNTTAGTCLVGTAVLIHAIASIYALLLMRLYATKLQDRIIRAEMRARLAEVLPAELRTASRQLTVQQLVGLRFASDEELPDLVRAVLDEHIHKADAIKKRIQNWQADNHRV